jgi:predicted ArsR family transcriptional regulator
VAARDDQDELLRQRTRGRLYRALIGLRRPATTEELAAEVALHRTGVLMHLRRLEAAGLVERHRIRQPRGRPRDAWSVAPGASPSERRPEAYADLATWLAAAITAGSGRLEEVEAAGRRLGRELAENGPAVPAEEHIQATFAALGFQPRRRSTGEGRLCFELGNCPYRAAARANQPVVCTLHRGLTRGMLDVVQPSAELRSFVPRDPDEAGCIVEIET